VPWVVGPVDMNIKSHPSTLVIGEIHNRIAAADWAIVKYASRYPRTTS